LNILTVPIPSIWLTVMLSGLDVPGGTIARTLPRSSGVMPRIVSGSATAIRCWMSPARICATMRSANARSPGVLNMSAHPASSSDSNPMIHTRMAVLPFCRAAIASCRGARKPQQADCIRNRSGVPALSILRTAFAVGILFATPAAAQQLTADETARVDAIVAESLKSSGVPSASIAIVRDGRIVYARAYGDQGPGMKATSADAKYQIASISKQFTAAAILLLEDEGKLSLDDTVAKWVPGVTDGDKITLRQLLSHTAGIQDYWPQDYPFALMDKPVTPQAIVDRWAKKPLDFAPGTAWQYSNTGFVVAGMVIEKASGMKLLDYLNARIFKPLDMHPIDQDIAIGKGFPQGNHRFALGPVRAAKPAAHGWLWAAGELAMSASDLAKWDIARIDRGILTPEDWATQETEVKLTDGSPTRYGLGVSVGTRGSDKTVSHGGEAVGFLSENFVVPDRRFAVVALVNADFGGATDEITSRITDLLLPTAATTTAPSIDQARDALARKVYDQLRAGTLDRALLTEDAQYYFTPQATEDYRASLAPLGEPDGFMAAGKPRLRGGFVNRNYLISYKGQRLVAITYAEPGAEGKFEQFLVQPR
jgi:D-alanyl-D-alanine carboxypeptidase